MTLEILPITELPEFREGDDIAAILAEPLLAAGFRSGDVVVVTQKVVSKAEGRVVAASPGDRDALIARETRRVVARRGDIVITETHHGFVCANAGVDESNIEAGMVSLLPEDPDASAERIREGLLENTGTDAAVLITDTFGRPWRNGLVNVAIGCSGIPALVDLRGSADAGGRALEATIVAVADEIAAASGLAMGKADRVPAVIVRGLQMPATPHGTAADLVRPPGEDMFRFSPLTSISTRRTIRSFGPGNVPREAIEEAVSAACTAPAPHHSKPWLFVTVDTETGRRALLGAMTSAWRRDLESDGTPIGTIERRLSASDVLLGTAPSLMVPLVRTDDSHPYPDSERSQAEREMFLLSAGAAIQNLLLGLHAQGLASAWVSSTLFCKEETREALDLDEGWLPMGAIAIGWPPDDLPLPRPEVDLTDFLEYR